MDLSWGIVFEASFGRMLDRFFMVLGPMLRWPEVSKTIEKTLGFLYILLFSLLACWEASGLSFGWILK